MELKRILIAFAFSGLLMAADGLTIPKDATANDNGTYAWTDKQGKHWTYVNTPWGVSRTQDVTAAPSTKMRPKGLPAGAKANPDGTYSYTDKDGAKWHYVITPFGPSRMPASEDGATAKQQSQIATVKVIDEGDTVRFERTTPFGVSISEKKKTELTEDEQRLLDMQTPAVTPREN